jgi:hypothetical protein
LPVIRTATLDKRLGIILYLFIHTDVFAGIAKPRACFLGYVMEQVTCEFGFYVTMTMGYKAVMDSDWDEALQRMALRRFNHAGRPVQAQVGQIGEGPLSPAFIRARPAPQAPENQPPQHSGGVPASEGERVSHLGDRLRRIWPLRSGGEQHFDQRSGQFNGQQRGGSGHLNGNGHFSGVRGAYRGARANGYGGRGSYNSY